MKTKLVLLFLALAPLQSRAAKLSAKDTVTAFYVKYLDHLSDRKRPVLAESKSFRKLVADDLKACRQFAKGDVCGFGADGDPYLDAQDYDDKLTFKTSHFTATEKTPHEIEANFILFPKEADQGHRTLTFKMIEEGGAWVADDIVASGGSARAMITNEIAQLKSPKKK